MSCPKQGLEIRITRLATIKHLETARNRAPLSHSIRKTFRKLFVKPQQSVAVAPPVIENEAGWQLIHSEDARKFEDWISKDPEGLPRLKGEEPSLGSHILIEFFDCDGSLLEQERTVGDAMLESARAAEATIVTHDFHEFKPYGVSGAVIIQESHFTIHTWPEHRYAAVDLFYCGGTIYIDRAIEVLRDRFKAERMKFLVVRRGMQSEVEGQ